MSRAEGLEYVVDDIGLRTSVHDAVDAIGNNPAKMVTMAALVRMREERLPIYPCTAQELGLYINGLQGDVAEGEGWLLKGSSTRAPFGYCETSMGPAGLVCSGSKVSEHSCRGGRHADTYSVTDRGADAGLAVAGDFMNWRLENDVSLADTLGAASGGVTGLRKYSATRRLAMLARLVDHPAVHVSMDNLSPAGQASKTEKGIVRQLAASGILLLGEKAYKPYQRRVSILRQPEGNPMAGYLEESQLVFSVLKGYFDSGSCEHSVGDILNRAVEISPGVDPDVVWQVIRQQVSRKIWKFIEVEDSTGKSWMRKKNVEIAPDYLGPVASLVGVYRDLLYSATQRAAARDNAIDIIRSNAAVALLMGAAREDSVHADDKNMSQERFEEAVTGVLTDGMPIRALYASFKEATGSAMRFPSFRLRLYSCSAFELLQGSDGDAGRIVAGGVCRVSRRDRPKPPSPPALPPPAALDESYALSGERSFWQLKARCSTVDPDTFVVSNNNDPARAVCARCPVKGDCLLWALDSSERHLIAGGFTPGERRNFDPSVAEWLRKSGRTP